MYILANQFEDITKSEVLLGRIPRGVGKGLDMKMYTKSTYLLEFKVGMFSVPRQGFLIL